MSEFIDVEWYDAGTSGLPGQNIGIVLVYNEHQGFKCYMGIGNGVSESDDMENIHKLGTKIDHKLASTVWGSRMAAEWITRHLADLDNSKYLYDGKQYARNRSSN